MDFNYNFKQAHQDRLEDAGVKKYRPQDGFRVYSNGNTPQPQQPRQERIRAALAAIANAVLLK